MSKEASSAERLDLKDLLDVLAALERGDFGPRMYDPDHPGLPTSAGEVARAVNAVIERAERFTRAVAEGCAEIGRDGQLGGSWRGGPMPGAWGAAGQEFQLMAGTLTNQIRNVGQVLNAMERGDYSHRMIAGANKEMQEFKEHLNSVLDRLERERAAGARR